MFKNVDAPGQAYNRRGVRAVQRFNRKERRIADAKAKRDMRAAKRAKGPNVILLYSFPPGGLNTGTPDGAYVQGGTPEVHGCYQVVVVGAPKGPNEDYRDAVMAWKQIKLRIVSSAPMTCNAADTLIERGFLNIILEPIKAAL